ncbi:MAG: lipid-A-disaccharide synthase [Chromatiales bacterium]|nr:lipid-A-disaccharide synthase [Chromatiales bacterium]
MALRVAIVAGEPSGDRLAAGLLRALRERVGAIEAIGVGGPKLMAEGLESVFPMEHLSHIGLSEVLHRIPALLRARRRLARKLIAAHPAVFVGVDSPDFNLGLEQRLRDAGVPTVHYVSPTIWAWRAGRVHTLRRAADRVLCIFPFEPALLAPHGIDARYVGHPLAEEMARAPTRAAARAGFGLNDEAVIALLPGSRGGEIERLGGLFVDTARWCADRRDGLVFLLGAANAAHAERLRELIGARAANVRIVAATGQARAAMAAADVVLSKSGTTTLETMLAGRPMVVAYRVSLVSQWIAQIGRLIKTPYFALPNILAGERLVPEFVQADATPEHLGTALFDWLDRPAAVATLRERFSAISADLRRDADQEAADAVAGLIAQRAAP